MNTISHLRSLWHYLWAWGSAAAFGRPSRKLVVVGVTGTKGKSTTVDLLHFVFGKAGLRSASFSSVYRKIGDAAEKNISGNSMPGRGRIQRFLSDAAKSGCRYVFPEVTSQGVLQYRHRFIEFDAALITNLSPEHIEAHGSFEAYRAAKLAFFREVLRSPKPAIRFFVNAEDADLELFAGLAPEKTGLFYKAGFPIPDTLFGEINSENIAAAAAVARAYGINDIVIEEAVRTYTGLAGRLQFISEEPCAVIVDYAHTPESFELLLSALARRYPALICVFGAAGGGRDRWKRKEMGRIAARYASYAIVTEEDPYDEDPRAIAGEIETGLREGGFVSYEIIESRREAIRRACSLAKPGQAVVITGKGSETSIHRAGGRREPWSDERVARAMAGGGSVAIVDN